jgi:hypothetical protein
MRMHSNGACWGCTEKKAPLLSLRRSAATAAISAPTTQREVRLPRNAVEFRQLWKSLCREGLRLLRPKGLAMTQ